MRFPIIERTHVRKVMRITRRNVATRDADGNVYFSILSGDANLFEVDVALQIQDREPEKLSLRQRRSPCRADAHRARAPG